MTRSNTNVLLSRRRLVAIGGLASGAALLGAPGSLSGSSVRAQDTADGMPSVTVAMNNEPNTFDPHMALGRHTETFLANIYDSLVKTGLDGQFIPGLAVSWEQLDETTWQFNLREGVTFHNGEPFDAEAVKFTFDRVLDPATESTIATLLATIDRVEIVDPMTVNIITSQPDIVLLARVSELYGAIIPPQYSQEVGFDTLGVEPVGTGPFRLVEWARNERIVLEANEDYWRGAPQVSQITVRPILEDSTRISALLAGEVDLINTVPYARIAELEADANIRIETVPSPRIFYVVIDPREPPFDDVRVRQAMNYAVDVDAIIQSLYMGNATRLATAVDVAAVGYDPTIEPYPYDPEMARQLLAEAGYPDGFDTTFNAFTGSIADHSQVAEAVVGYLREVGINAQMNMMEFGVFGPQRVANEAGPLFIYSIGNWAREPALILNWMMQGDGSLFYQNPEILGLLEEALETFDPEERSAIYTEVQELLREDAGFIYLLQADSVFAMQQDIIFQPRPDELFDLYPLAVAETS
jgi:peptide/nickel transport system substrate-binding protein